MTLENAFVEFLKKIRLSKNQRKDLITGHNILRKRLYEYEPLSKYIVTTFLQGSYKRGTSIRPKNGKRADVDVVVVTNLDRTQHTPKDVLDLFNGFVEKYYKGKYEAQGRSIGIELSYVDLDLVVTSAPSLADQAALKSKSVTNPFGLEEVQNDWRFNSGWDLNYAWNASQDELVFYNVIKSSLANGTEWRIDPLHIPDHNAGKWDETHPLEQIRWTRDKNKSTNGHYINIVKALKWWRVCNLIDLKYPKGYPLEHMIGDCCPDGITSVPEGIVRTLENIVARYQINRSIQTVPILRDRGVPSHNVWHRISESEFGKFYDHVREAAILARRAFDASKTSEKLDLWNQFFGGGSEFPVFSDSERKTESLLAKVTNLNGGQSSIGNIGKNIGIISGMSGVKVPPERNDYDVTKDL